MRSLLWIAVAGLMFGATGVGAATLSEAQLAEEEGRWDEAVDLWRDLSALGESRSGAQGRSMIDGYLRVLEIAGQHEELDRESARIAARYPGWDVPLLHRARVMAGSGRLEEAVRLLEPASSWEARVERARFLGRLGQHDLAGEITVQALKAYRPARKYSARELLAFARAAEDQGDFEGAARLFETAYRDSLEFIEARIALAYLFQSKYQDNLAQEELVELQRLAPRHPDVNLAIAHVSMESGRLSAAEPAALKVLAVREHDPRANGILAFLALASSQPDAALEQVRSSLERDPADLELRSLAAAAYYLSDDMEQYQEEVGRILAQDPRYFDVYLDLARILRFSRRHEECFTLFDQVLAMDPENPRALLAKGLLLMREGEEEESRVLLERGFEGDPFNLRAYNQLLLLDKMDTFAVYRTRNFEIRLEADKDSSLVPLLEESLERIYEELVESHGRAPDVPTVIELMPSHDWFSARVTGLPWIGGIPAVCFGDVIAMDSPRYLGGTLNWEDVLRHEFGHVLALSMTNKKVPFWFTEGLSVFLEHFPRDENWDANLVGHYLDRSLVPLDSLTIAFTRPRNHSQRLLAYHESSLIIRDLVERKGWDTIPALLLAFGAGKSLDSALREVAGESEQELAVRTMEVVRKEAASLAVWPAPNRSRLVRLEAVREDRSDDVSFLELLALTQFQMQLLEVANATAKEILALDDENARAHGILGLGYQQAGQKEDARSHLEKAAGFGSRDVPVYVGLAGMAISRADTAAAIDYYGVALELYPRSHEARGERARLLAASGDREAAVREYQALISLSASAAAGAVALARMEMEDGRGEEAARALEYALAILPLDAEVVALRGRAFLLLDRDREAYELFLKARRFDLKNVESMVGMAEYYFKRKDYEEAAYFAELALKYEPDHPTALEVLALARAE